MARKANRGGNFMAPSGRWEQYRLKRKGPGVTVGVTICLASREALVLGLWLFQFGGETRHHSFAGELLAQLIPLGTG